MKQQQQQAEGLGNTMNKEKNTAVEVKFHFHRVSYLCFRLLTQKSGSEGKKRLRKKNLLELQAVLQAYHTARPALPSTGGKAGHKQVQVKCC